MNSSKKDVVKYQLYQEVSAGGVVVIVDKDKPKFVVIDRAVIKDTSLPKGHQEAEESLQQTAIREVLEETGYQAKPVEYLGEFTYEVKNEVKKRITLTTVYWFLMIVESGKPIKGNNETKQVRLLPFDTDLTILNYENHRMFVQKAKKRVDKYLTQK